LSFINLDSQPPPEALDALRAERSIVKLLLIDM